MHTKHRAVNDDSRTELEYSDYYLPATPSDALVDVGQRIARALHPYK